MSKVRFLPFLGKKMFSLLRQILCPKGGSLASFEERQKRSYVLPAIVNRQKAPRRHLGNIHHDNHTSTGGNSEVQKGSDLSPLFDILAQAPK